MESRSQGAALGEGPPAGPDTYIAHEDLLGGSKVPLDLTVHGVQDDNAIVTEDVEHVPHAEAWEEQTRP